MKNKLHHETIEFKNLESQIPVPIIADGSIASASLGDGKCIPVLIIDTSKRSDINDLVKAINTQLPGDVRSGWINYKKQAGLISLFLNFERPSEIIVILEFNIIRQGILIESILSSKALYLQPGKNGDKVSSTFCNDRILVEVPDMGFYSQWNEIFQKQLEIYFRKNGADRKTSEVAAINAIVEARKIIKLRIK